VLAYPKMTGFNSIAYIIPIIAIFLGVVILALYIRRDKVK